jgi:hypothetical protein
MDSFNARVVARNSTGDGEGHFSPGWCHGPEVCAVLSPQRGARCAILVHLRAILVHLRDGCELHDIASKNGTYLNGVRLSRPTRLRSGDEIRVCDQRFVFLSRQDADPRFLDTLARQQ